MIDELIDFLNERDPMCKNVTMTCELYMYGLTPDECT